MSATDIAIIGAGPYGLSLAAHLAERGVSFRIFGKPMESWLTQMPRGMHLKSEGFASSLYDPKGLLTLGKYCGEQDLAYGDMGLPVPLSLFCEYGLAFQHRMVPSLDRRMVTALRSCAEGFALQLDDGETLSARKVVVAVGISHFAQMPTCLAGAPSVSVSHSSEHADVSGYKDKDVLVVGAGASAVDLSVLLHEAGAKVRLATRRKELEVHTRMQLPRPLSDRLSAPMTGIGPSWRSWFFSHAAPVFHRFPEARRLKWVRTHLGPAAGWFMTERLRAVPVLTGKTLMGVEKSGEKTVVIFKNRDGSFDRLLTDHVIAATGYHPDISRLTFLDPGLRAAIATLDRAPVLSSRFQSSVAGLYFIGPAAAHSFGPLMRFAVGAKFTSPRLAAHLARTSKNLPSRAKTDPAPAMAS